MSYYKLSLFPYLLIEILFSLGFVLFFGFGNFIIFLLLSMLLGAILLGIFWKNMLEFRLSSPLEMLKNFALVIAGFLLVIPGVLSSIFALFILLFGLIFGQKSSKNFNESSNFTQNSYKEGSSYQGFNSQKNSNLDSEIIDVEIIETKRD
ncbi:FxsA family protein [Campylobacter troglodytis]|uniref:FxsA family protein n=1 Tax=Campylobacter troglodytis TaxID=654363 RepID=UPI001157102C|nr:FxsA family protein [Campylobacter troglodytis]TQR60553.1 integral memnbrane protein [Campylobacter troglodytis]